MRIFFTFLVLGITFQIVSQNPVSDAANNAGWILNSEMSDEFNDGELDKSKWWILGENNDYRHKWKGRAPGQYVPHNVKVENGELVLMSQWEPNYNFVNEKHNESGVWYGGTTAAADNSKPITQSCIMSEKFFKYGYMEIRAKIADAPVTSAFWTTGYHSEIDMVENYGKRPIGNPRNTSSVIERKQRTNLISWDPDRPSNHQNWKVENNMGVRLAENYHVYGFEWDKDYIKTYVDGVLLRHVTRQELEANNQWKHDAPQELWLDAEVFYWYGLPSASDLVNPAEFKIDYVRIWQKEINSGDFNALGFEGPFHFQGRSVNWWNSGNVKWRLKTEKSASGDFSLRFQDQAPFSGNYSTFSPFGSLDLPAGSNSVKFKIWMDENTAVDQLEMILNKPYINLKFDLTNIQKGQWVEISKTFSRNTASSSSLTNGDRIQLRLRSENIKSNQVKMYIDDIVFNDATASTQSLDTIDFSIFPNPAQNSFKVNSVENGKLQLYNLSGTLIKTIYKTDTLLEVPTQNLSQGLYMVKFIVGNKQSIRKLVVQ